MKVEFRTLRADEIECRVGTINEKGFTVLLYKDARCDMDASAFLITNTGKVPGDEIIYFAGRAKPITPSHKPLWEFSHLVVLVASG